MADVVTLGEAMALLVGTDNASLRRVGTFRRSVAGAESNVAVGVRRLGWSAQWIGRVGDDAFGEGVLRALRSEGVDVDSAVVDRGAPTGLLIRDRHATRPIEVVYHRAGSAGSRLSVDDLRPDHLAGARVLHISGVTAALSPSACDAVLGASRLAAELGVPVCLDPNLRLKLWAPTEAVPVLSELASHATLVIAGRKESELLVGRNGDDHLADWYLERGAQLVVIKDGVSGCWATDGRELWRQPAFPARTVDPVGAGDAFAAGFLSSWLAGEPAERCLITGAAAGAIAIEEVGDIEGLPFPDELLARIAGNTEVRR